MRDIESLIAWARKEYKAYRGQVIGVHFAMLSRPDGNYREATFPRARPLRVRITNALPTGPEFFDVLDEEGSLLDTFWEAEALPGQLSGDDYVSWIDGPTYHQDGRRETLSWEKGTDFTGAGKF